MSRIFLIVLDSFGIGALPDAEKFGNLGVNTLRSCQKTGKLNIPNMISLGLGNIEGIDCIEKSDSPIGAYGKSMEMSNGKDTTVGHWEISGIISEKPLPTYPDGFPEEVLDAIRRETGRDILCNLPYSGTAVIKEYGQKQKETGALIVYTSADSVLQIAAHEDDIPIEEQYDICRRVRNIMIGDHAVGRIIARPYVGEYPNYVRTSNRRDFSLEPTGVTMLDEISEAGLDVIAVGKIEDIFVGRGITDAIHTSGNTNGMEVTSEVAKRDYSGLCFVNLVDFDSMYGHRNNADGYAEALSEFDSWLGGFMKEMRDDDIVIITADHGCDPDDGEDTDHTREYTPILVYGKGINAGDLGVRRSFSDISATVTELLGVCHTGAGESFAPELIGYKNEEELLLSLAREAAKGAYTPYSGFNVGAALLTKDGTIYTGCNIENAAYGPTVCAERVAFFKAVSEGVREFSAIAVVGGPADDVKSDKKLVSCPPCGVCRQVMMEFCDRNSFRIILGSPDAPEIYTLNELLPLGFGPSNLN